MTMAYVIVTNSINPVESKRFTVMHYTNAKTSVSFIFKQVSCGQATLKCMRIGTRITYFVLIGHYVMACDHACSPLPPM